MPSDATATPAHRRTRMLANHPSAEIMAQLEARRKAAPDEGRALERAIIGSIVASPYPSLLEAVAPLHSHWPEGLRDRRLRAALHLALELDALSPHELVELLRPLFASADRFDDWMRADALVELSGRMRVATLCRAVALAVRATGGLTAVIPDDRIEAFHAVLERLFFDRDYNVGARAAWAVGLLAQHDSRVGALLERAQRSDVAGDHSVMLKRRSLVAFTAQFVVGDVESAAFDKSVATDSAWNDVYSRASVIRALSLGVSTAPFTVITLAESLLRVRNADVLVAASEFAQTLEPGTARARIVAAVADAATSLKVDTEGPLRFWLEPRPAAAEALLANLDTLCADMSINAADARRSSADLLHRATASVAQLTARYAGETSDAVDRALDVVLFGSPLLRDALIASAGSTPEAVERHKGWVAVVAGLLKLRSERFEASGSVATEQRERVNRLFRALDSYPRRDTGATAPECSATFVQAARRTAASTFTLAARSESKQTDRPLALAFATAVDPLLATGSIAAIDVLAIQLRLARPGFTRHLAGTVYSRELRLALESWVDVSEAVDDLTNARGVDRVRFATFLTTLGHLASAASRLGSLPSDPLVEGLRSLLLGATGMSPASAGRTAVRLPSTWTAAIVNLSIAGRSAASRLGTTLGTLVSARKAEASVTRVLSAEAMVQAAVTGGVELRQGIERVEALLPPLLRGCFAPLVRSILRDPHRVVDEIDVGKPRADAEIRRGDIIGDYVVVETLGAGQMGQCVLAKRRVEQWDKQAALWVLKAPREFRMLAEFREEARALLTLSGSPHPSIVKFVSFVAHGYRTPFLVMEYVRGESLGKLLSQGPLPLNQVVALGHALSESLSHAHALGVGHFDVKPDNIVIARGKSQRPVLVDWGLAGGSPNAGTPLYMSPERWTLQRKRHSGGVRLSTPADVFSLGCILAEMVTAAPLMSPVLTDDEARSCGSVAEALAMMTPALRQMCALEILASDEGLLQRRVARSLEGAPSQLTEIVQAMVHADPSKRTTAAQAAAVLGALKV